MLHEDTEKAEVLTLTRAIIEVPSVMGDRRKPNDEWDFMLDPAKKIGYIRITNFIQDTTDHVKDAVEEPEEGRHEGLILDLRDDPGGLLSAAVEISDLFVEDGKIVSTRGRNTAEKTYEAHKEGTYTGFPMVVLVNHNSASASEILAACLQDHDRAVVVGERSFGKGSVQNILDLEDGNSVLKLTVATYWRPSGKNIHRFKNAKETDEWGVSPSQGMERQALPRGIPRLVPRPTRPRLPLQPQQAQGRETQGRRGQEGPAQAEEQEQALRRQAARQGGGRAGREGQVVSTLGASECSPSTIPGRPTRILMSLTELSPTVLTLSRRDKLRLIRALAEDLARIEDPPAEVDGGNIGHGDEVGLRNGVGRQEEEVSHRAGEESVTDAFQAGSPLTAASRSYPYWSPDRDQEAAALLMNMLEAEKSKP